MDQNKIYFIYSKKYLENTIPNCIKFLIYESIWSINKYFIFIEGVLILCDFHNFFLILLIIKFIINLKFLSKHQYDNEIYYWDEILEKKFIDKHHNKWSPLYQVMGISYIIFIIIDFFWSILNHNYIYWYELVFLIVINNIIFEIHKNYILSKKFSYLIEIKVINKINN